MIILDFLKYTLDYSFFIQLFVFALLLTIEISAKKPSKELAHRNIRIPRHTTPTPGVILTLCCFVGFTTGRFILNHAVLFLCVFVCFLFCFVFFSHFSIVITSLGEERAGVCAFRAFICLF